MTQPEHSSAPPSGSSCGSGGRRSYSDELRAQIIAYAKLHGVGASSRKYNVPLRTLHQWTAKERVKPTPRATELTRLAGDKWADEVLATAAAVIIAGGARQLEAIRAGAELGPKDLHAWAGAMKLANDAKTTAELLEQRKRPPKPAAPPPKPAPVVAIAGEARKCA